MNEKKEKKKKVEKGTRMRPRIYIYMSRWLYEKRYVHRGKMFDSGTPETHKLFVSRGENAWIYKQQSGVIITGKII